MIYVYFVVAVLVVVGSICGTMVMILLIIIVTLYKKLKNKRKAPTFSLIYETEMDEILYARTDTY